MDICPKCEKVILSDYKFCPRCGHSLYGEAPTGAPESINTGCNVEISERTLRFFSVAQELSTATDLDQLLSKIGSAIEDILGAERSAIMLLDDTGKNLFFKAATGEEILKKLRVPVGQGIAGWIAENRKSDIVNDPYNDPRFSPETDKKTGFRTKSIVGVPMIVGNELIGIAEAINKKEGEFDNNDMETLIGFAGLAAVSITNTRLKTDQKNFFANMLDFLVMGSESLGAPEPTENGHSWNMARYATQLGKELGFDVEKLQLLSNAALIHDIGFLGLENMDLVGIKIDMELDAQKKYLLHPIIGAEMIKGIKIMQKFLPFIRYHHRYKNGTGFPSNLPPENITPEIEVISILEDFFTTGSKDKIEPDKYSPEVFQAFCKVVN
jgi:putative methionine-R-sulfoxide reductase with GAF domain